TLVLQKITTTPPLRPRPPRRGVGSASSAPKSTPGRSTPPPRERQRRPGMGAPVGDDRIRADLRRRSVTGRRIYLPAPNVTEESLRGVGFGRRSGTSGTRDARRWRSARIRHGPDAYRRRPVTARPPPQPQPASPHARGPSWTRAST